MRPHIQCRQRGHQRDHREQRFRHEFNNRSSAGNATITNNGRYSVSGRVPAGNATIITKQWLTTLFIDNSNGGNARLITDAAGVVDFSLTTGGLGNRPADRRLDRGRGHVLHRRQQHAHRRLQQSLDRGQRRHRERLRLRCRPGFAGEGRHRHADALRLQHLYRHDHGQWRHADRQRQHRAVEPADRQCRRHRRRHRKSSGDVDRRRHAVARQFDRRDQCCRAADVHADRQLQGRDRRIERRQDQRHRYRDARRHGAGGADRSRPVRDALYDPHGGQRPRRAIRRRDRHRTVGGGPEPGQRRHPDAGAEPRRRERPEPQSEGGRAGARPGDDGGRQQPRLPRAVRVDAVPVRAGPFAIVRRARHRRWTGGAVVDASVPVADARSVRRHPRRRGRRRARARLRAGPPHAGAGDRGLRGVPSVLQGAGGDAARPSGSLDGLGRGLWQPQPRRRRRVRRQQRPHRAHRAHRRRFRAPHLARRGGRLRAVGRQRELPAGRRARQRARRHPARRVLRRLALRQLLPGGLARRFVLRRVERPHRVAWRRQPARRGLQRHRVRRADRRRPPVHQGRLRRDPVRGGAGANGAHRRLQRTRRRRIAARGAELRRGDHVAAAHRNRRDVRSPLRRGDGRHAALVHACRLGA